MKIFTSLEEIKLNRKTVVALGNFDGIHVGHRRILEDAVGTAHRNGMLAVCFTFSVHPKEVMDNGILLISTEADKMRMLEETGIDVVVNIPFDEKIMKTRPIDFIDGILIGTLNAGAVCCGFNYRFGDMASGDAEFLREYGEKRGMDVYVHAPVVKYGETVSSTAVRQLIEDGKMELCEKYLGRPYSLSGTVVKGNSLGAKIGFPTANFCVPDMLVIPPDGVYITDTVIGEKTYRSVTNIGTKPTVGGTERSVETNIFDFSDKIYGDQITVMFRKWLRPEHKFEGIAELTEQIAADSEAAEKFREHEER